MTKPASILVAPKIDLRTVPPQDRDAVRRFLFECIRGLDPQHDKRWRRLWSRIWKSEPGEATQLLILAPRSRKFHARHMAIETRLFESQDAFVNQNRFRDWLKTGAGFGNYELVGQRMKFIPASVSYDDCSDDEMREFHENAIAFMRTPRAQRRLWPHLTAIKRSEMVDWILMEQNNP